ncbi:beta-ketoacyl-ACP synthase II [candidate division KSB1 bacterium]|nr:beta-ketoacyl-ACP synthase II [candidate division KSB1 bacterium]
MNKRVVVTGMGILSPLAIDLGNYWTSLVEGRSGVDYITRFDTTDFDVKIAAEIKDLNIDDWLDKKESRKMDGFTRYGVIAAELAVKDANIDFDKTDRSRVGVITGSGIGGMETFEKEYRTYFEKGPNRVSPFFIPMMIPDILPGRISIQYGCKGPNYTVISACASASHAIGNAFRDIKHGVTDVMITGGSEATITPMGIAGFSNMKALSTRNDDPKHASRPFDKERDGFIVGEGAAIIILESEEHAIKRGAKIYAEICGVGFSADAYHITAPVPDGEGAAQAMLAAIAEAGVGTGEIDYINAHGTSTPYNDKTETQAIKKAFGDRAYDIPISSTKSMIGHLLGASGAAELVATILCLSHDTIHPTINYEVPDPECDLNYTPNKAVRKELNYVLSNSFGFGGHNASILVAKYR